MVSELPAGLGTGTHFLLRHLSPCSRAGQICRFALPQVSSDISGGGRCLSVPDNPSRQLSTSKSGVLKLSWAGIWGNRDASILLDPKRDSALMHPLPTPLCCCRVFLQCLRQQTHSSDSLLQCPKPSSQTAKSTHTVAHVLYCPSPPAASQGAWQALQLGLPLFCPLLRGGHLGGRRQQKLMSA